MTEIETRPPRPLWFWILLLLVALLAGWLVWAVLSETDDVRDASETVAARTAHPQFAIMTRTSQQRGGVSSPGTRKPA